MKILKYTTITLGLLNTPYVNASFLSYTSTDTTSIKMSVPKGSNPQIRKMFANMASKAATKTSSKIYIHNGVHANHSSGGTVFIQDYNKNQFIDIDHNARTYSLRGAIKVIENGLQKTNTATQYTDLKRTKTIHGRTCHFYKSEHNSTYNSIKIKSIINSCVLKKSPDAWIEFYAKSRSMLKNSSLPQMKKILNDVKGTGFPLYTKTKTKMALITSTASQISTKSFDLSKIKIPAGYKKIKTSNHF